MSLVPVTVPCSCPERPHEQDTVELAGVLDAPMGAAVLALINASPSTVEAMEFAIGRAFLRLGIRAWSFTDEDGAPLPITADNIDERLTWVGGGMEVTETANDLYAQDLFRPLVKRMSKGSNSGRTASSTSRTRSSGRSTPSSAKPSLRAVTDGPQSEVRAS